MSNELNFAVEGFKAALRLHKEVEEEAANSPSTKEVRQGLVPRRTVHGGGNGVIRPTK